MYLLEIAEELLFWYLMISLLTCEMQFVLSSSSTRLGPGMAVEPHFSQMRNPLMQW